MKWKDIINGYQFVDKSKVVQKHRTHMYDCYELEYNNQKIILSKDHIIQVNIKKLQPLIQQDIKEFCTGEIPLKENIQIDLLGDLSDKNKGFLSEYIIGNIDSVPFKIEETSSDELESYCITLQDNSIIPVKITRIPTVTESQRIDDFNYWIPIEGLAYLFNKYREPLQINDCTKIINFKHVGKLECFCVSTDTGHYKLNGLIHHNSVMIQNVIIHCLEHRDKIAIGMVDPKQVEFSNYKGMNGVVGVANNTREAVELLRIARQVMLKRNKEMAQLGVKSLTEYKPHIKTDKIFVTGREYNKDDIIKVRVDGVEQEMTADALFNLLQED